MINYGLQCRHPGGGTEVFVLRYTNKRSATKAAKDLNRRAQELSKPQWWSVVEV